jgi:hypothetical protein
LLFGALAPGNLHGLKRSTHATRGRQRETGSRLGSRAHACNRRHARAHFQTERSFERSGRSGSDARADAEACARAQVCAEANFHSGFERETATACAGREPSPRRRINPDACGKLRRALAAERNAELR